ncbi:MAG: SirB2 family protein [Woeseiaceae bacterium]|jgi:uncharacterized membrane protein SirB2
MYLLLKTAHSTLALLTVSGFILRGYWMLRASPNLKHRLTRILPHVFDAALFALGIALIFKMNLNVMQHAWLLAKFGGLVVYIGLGMVALRFGRARLTRLLAFAGALAAFAYIFGVAVSKSPTSWVAYVAASLPAS